MAYLIVTQKENLANNQHSQYTYNCFAKIREITQYFTEFQNAEHKTQCSQAVLCDLDPQT